MNKLQEHIISIEGKLGLLLSKLKSLKKENDRLKRELEDKTREWEDQKKKTEQLSLQLELSSNNDNETLRSTRQPLKRGSIITSKKSINVSHFWVTRISPSEKKEATRKATE